MKTQDNPPLKGPGRRKGTKALALFLALVFTCLLAPPAAAHPPLHTGVLRIHLRANSNSQEDQAVKFRVLEGVSAFLAPLLSGLTTLAEREAAIEACLVQLSEIAESVSGLPCRAEIREEYFPDRQYETGFFPAGVYRALIIEIGEGKGNNWWCVIFPVFCYPAEAKEPEKPSIPPVLRPAAPSLNGSPKKEKRVRYRFFVAEWLQKTFWAEK